MRVLIVEDTSDVAEGVMSRLRAAGYAVEWACNAMEALDKAPAGHDLIILDVMLPGKDGFYILEKLRKIAKSPKVLMLTACGEIEERVRALDLGADDYLVKPFDFRELEARVRVLLRRTGNGSEHILKVGKLCLDVSSRTVKIGHRPIELTRRETALLEVLCSEPGRICSKDELIDRVFSYEEIPSENLIEQYVARLRKKLVDAGFQIKTLRGLGYQIILP